MLTRRRALRSRNPVTGLVAVVGVALLMLLPAVPAKAVLGARSPGGSYKALNPARLADTRTGLGGVPNGPTRILVVSTAGRAGVPAKGVSAVSVNITIRSGSVGGFVSAYPTGSPRPPTSNVSFVRMQTVTKMAVSSVNRAGQFTIEASAPAHFVVDVEGYFTSADNASTRGLFNPLKPQRILDSNSRIGAGALGPGSTAVVQVTGRGGVPAAGVSAVVINTTVAGSTSTGYVTDYPTGSARPATPTVTFAPSQTVANLAIVPVGIGGAISIYNDTGTTLPVIDVTGYFTDGVVSSTGGYFVPITSSRVVDTRFWQTTSYLSTQRLKTQKIAGQNCVLSPAITLCGRVLVPPVTAHPRPIAALLNITALPIGGSGYLTVFPAGSTTPSSSDISFTSTTAASNLAFVGLGAQGEVSVHISGGLSDVVEDVSGYFVLPARTPPPVRVTKGAAWKAPAYGGRLVSGRVSATASAPASLAATSGPTPPSTLRKSGGGTVALPAQLNRPSPGGSSASTTTPSVAPPSRAAAPVTALLQTAAPVTALSQTTAPVSALPQTAAPVTALSQTTPPVSALSRSAPSVTPGPAASQFARPSPWSGGHCQDRGHRGHQGD